MALADLRRKSRIHKRTGWRSIPEKQALGSNRLVAHSRTDAVPIPSTTRYRQCTLICTQWPCRPLPGRGAKLGRKKVGRNEVTRANLGAYRHSVAITQALTQR